AQSSDVVPQRLWWRAPVQERLGIPRLRASHLGDPYDQPTKERYEDRPIPGATPAGEARVLSRLGELSSTRPGSAANGRLPWTVRPGIDALFYPERASDREPTRRSVYRSHCRTFIYDHAGGQFRSDQNAD